MTRGSCEARRRPGPSCRGCAAPPSPPPAATGSSWSSTSGHPRAGGPMPAGAGGGDAGGTRLGLRFGMTGRLVVDGLAGVDRLLYASDRGDEAWDRFSVRFADGGRLVVHDPRLLGGVELDPDESLLGPDAASVSPAELHHALEHSAVAVKARLMDQRRLAGVGNLMADEILWRAGLAPNGAPPRCQRRSIAGSTATCGGRSTCSSSGGARTWATSCPNATRGAGARATASSCRAPPSAVARAGGAGATSAERPRPLSPARRAPWRRGRPPSRGTRPARRAGRGPPGRST